MPSSTSTPSTSTPIDSQRWEDMLVEVVDSLRRVAVKTVAHTAANLVPHQGLASFNGSLVASALSTLYHLDDLVDRLRRAPAEQVLRLAVLHNNAPDTTGLDPTAAAIAYDKYDEEKRRLIYECFDVEVPKSEIGFGAGIGYGVVGPPAPAIDLNMMQQVGQQIQALPQEQRTALLDQMRAIWADQPPQPAQRQRRRRKQNGRRSK